MTEELAEDWISATVENGELERNFNYWSEYWSIRSTDGLPLRWKK